MIKVKNDLSKRQLFIIFILGLEIFVLGIVTGVSLKNYIDNWQGEKYAIEQEELKKQIVDPGFAIP